MMTGSMKIELFKIESEMCGMEIKTIESSFHDNAIWL